jgi:hypothetical protein
VKLEDVLRGRTIREVDARYNGRYGFLLTLDDGTLVRFRAEIEWWEVGVIDVFVDDDRITEAI